MNILPKKLTHHAYLLTGDSTLKDLVLDELSDSHSIATKANPDFFDRTYASFAIDDARELKSLHDTRPIGESGKKVFVISMSSITIEAQNAILKLLEEPAEYANFFLIVPSAHILLPTVKSRLHIIEVGERGERNQSVNSGQSQGLFSEAKEFIKFSPAKRLEVVKELVDDISKEKKTRQQAMDFLNAIEKVVYTEQGIKKGQKMLEAIDLARKYMNDRSPSVKMLLEYVSLS